MPQKLGCGIFIPNGFEFGHRKALGGALGFFSLPVKALPFAGHAAQQIWAGKAVAIGVVQLIAAFGRIGAAQYIKPAERAA